MDIFLHVNKKNIPKSLTSNAERLTFVRSIRRTQNSYHLQKFAIMITQKVILEVLKTGNLVTPNANDSFLIEKTFGALDRSKNYSWMFKKTREYWSDKNWKAVAKDVQESIAHYKSK